MKIYFATWLEDKSLGKSMTELGANNRLLSYHFLKVGVSAKLPKNALRRYIKTGKEERHGKKRTD